ncbi:MAG: GNAT family N-acetyltransferase [Neoaquamicrobium sediminum]|uniref:GNAT family N-acetyltransferase n=1 Tax=Neoaquamicrobium sediminum TaxID=1849104 RepID=UPI0040360ABA
MTDHRFEILACDAAMLERRIGEFSALLQACVQDGASISFIMPFSIDDADAFWRGKVLPGVAAGSSLLLVAEAEGRIAGSVQLDHDTPPNQPHRAEVRKLLVHPDFRRRGLARALMAELEAHARLLRRSLLTLDTRTGDRAEPLYASLGYQTVGVIPNFCRDPFAADKLDGTTIMYKAL